MPRILIYEECLAAGSAGPLGAAMSTELLSEGQAMAFAFAEDCTRCNGWHVRVARAAEYRDRWPEQVPWSWLETPLGNEDSLNVWLGQQSSQVDLTMIIAPECQGILERRARAVVGGKGQLLGPDPEWIALTTDKTATLRRLADFHIPVARGVQGTLAEVAKWTGPFPAVLKPNDGVGACGVRRVMNHPQLLVAVQELALLHPSTAQWRCEEFIPGQAASVAVIAGRVKYDVLLPATQHIEFDAAGVAHYRG